MEVKPVAQWCGARCLDMPSALLPAHSGLGRFDPAPFPAVQLDGFTIQCHTDWPTDPALLADWSALASCVFVSPWWLGAAWKPYAAGRRLRLFTIFRNDCLAGALAMRLSHDGCLYSIGADFCDYLDPTVAVDAWPVLLSYIASLWDESIVDCSFLNVPAGSGSRQAISVSVPATGLALEESPGGFTSVVQLPRDWHAYLQQLPAHARKEIRRKLRKAGDEAGARLVACRTPGESMIALRQCLDWMVAAGSSNKAESARSHLRPFLLETAEPLIAAGEMQLLTLHLFDRPACHLIELPTSAGPCLYNIAHDPGQRQYSPGVAAVALSIRRAIAAGFSCYDFLRGRSRFKSDLGAVDRPLYQLLLRPRAV